MKLRLLLGLGVLLGLGLAGSTAFGAPPGAGSCSGGAIPAGTYNGFTVTGNCTFAGGAVTINGNLTVADGAFLNDHDATHATVHVTGNVTVGKGAVLGLGNYSPVPPHNSAIIDGNLTANQPLTLYLGGITVHGNLVSNGGGSGPAGPFRNFPTKDDRVGGNLVIQGWQGGWIGVIRVDVGGNAIVSKNASVVTPDGSPPPDSDSTEVQTNHIGGNLICQGNTPPAQVNPGDGGQPNVVAGQKIGECAGL
jgi:hypothetical protein